MDDNKLPKGVFMTVGKEIAYYIKPANQDSVALQWTTTPPTVEGWYWVTKRRGGVAVVQVVKGIKGKLVVGNGEYEEEFQDWQIWLGPLPEPEPPQG